MRNILRKDVASNFSITKMLVIPLFFIIFFYFMKIDINLFDIHYFKAAKDKGESIEFISDVLWTFL